MSPDLSSRPRPVVDRMTDWLERQSRIDPLAERVGAAVAAVPLPAWARDLLSGRQLGHPLHPALVIAPAGFLLSATTLDVAGGGATRAAVRRLVGLGLLSATPAAVAGWSDWLDTEGAEKRVGLVHAAANVAGLCAYAIGLRRLRADASARGWTLAGAGALGAASWLGGHLAFALGVGVDTTAFQAGPEDWADATAAVDVSDELVQVTVAGVPLLLTRLDDGRVVALADRCTHRGGPLSGGERAGGCVTCPWHGSQFELASGEVRRGPATRPAPVYETREAGGRIEVRRQEQRALRLNPVGV
ncbi:MULTISPECIES: Rieske (2Fe-2S) protein [Pseudofrankia]|uniref:Rieske (2Fe-2S) protein n=1 Tax=Pseudofrankia TaxID=2994363 RepID=UPI000234CFBE|nr:MULTISPECIES: Rieske (2Fe-2S) protein [Pseudofrankia]OHV34153.1 (2Fe-2S)-binding protein [Pseudofrankia sp. EUN1h]